MTHNSLSNYIHRKLPAMGVDAAIVLVSLVLALNIRAITSTFDYQPALMFGLIAVVVNWIVNSFTHLYDRLWRYASASEVVVIGAAVAISTFVLTLIDIVSGYPRLIPLSTIPLAAFFSFTGFMSVRYRRRVWTGFLWRWRAVRGKVPEARTKVLIVGAGEAGQLLAWRLLNLEGRQDYELVAFADEDQKKVGMRIHGVQVKGNLQSIPKLVTEFEVDLIIIANDRITGPEFRTILDVCEGTSAAIKVLPNYLEVIRGTKSLPPIRDVGAQDLLGRTPIDIDRDSCRRLLSGRTILVTGAAGSIGSELCRRIINFGPQRLVMLDNNESGLYDLGVGLECRTSPEEEGDYAGGGVLTPVVADITNEVKMRMVFDAYRPEIVFHAAAYKHVPLMESHPDEAVRVNILGTLTLAELADCYGVERFVLVSTDKAVNPSSIMGTTKWLCEALIDSGMLTNHRQAIANSVLQEMGEVIGSASRSTIGLPSTSTSTDRTLFTAVRFGNVLGSRGSVVPTFERQIDQGGPVTITHPDMTRYFMSVSEAASLIIQAAAFTEGSDIFMLDMGQQIRIDELAQRLIRLRGLRPHVDIPIVYTGPRPGERMQETLMADGEQRYPTSHPRIFRIQCRNDRNRWLTRSQIERLVSLATNQQKEELVVQLRELASVEAPEPLVGQITPAPVIAASSASIKL